jgi:Zn-dependent protease
LLFEFFRGEISFFFVLSWLVGIAVAITVHEFAHAYIAHKCGDDTAKRQGRITLNPLAHYDPIGTTMILIAGMGWGKAVPVNPANYRDSRWDDVKVSIAGPVSNLMVVTLIVVLLRFITMPWGPWEPLLNTVVLVNLMLAFFNLIPVYPLDGSHIMAGLLPPEQARSYERVMGQYGFFILIGLIFLVPGLLRILVWVPAGAFMRFLSFFI